MKNLSFAVFALALTAMPAFANNRLKHAGFEINPVNDVVYEAVSEGAHGGGAAFWRAAGLFVETVLKSPPSIEIYVVQGRAASVTTNRRSAAQFTIDPTAAGVTPVALSDDLNNLNVGEHMPANLARNFCNG